MRIGRQAICVITLFAASSDQETGVSKQLAAPPLCTDLLAAIEPG